ncbi:MAG: hypothetical protein SOR95_07025 [Sutterella sp.]|nr:hypothetical protein [Sutterella sp.]
MLDWLLRTGAYATPFLIPLGILIFIKRPTFHFTWRSQQLCTQLFFVMYAFSLMLFVAHAYAVKTTPEEFFMAFWGMPSYMTVWCFSAYIAQALSIVALLFAVNWSVIRNLNPRLVGSRPLHEITSVNRSDRAVEVVEQLQQESLAKSRRDHSDAS